MTKFILRRSSGETYDLPQLRVRAGRDSYGLELRQRLEHTPESQEGHVLGDGVELARPFTLTFLVKDASPNAIDLEVRTIRGEAELASSLLRERDGSTTYRALLGVEHIVPHPEGEVVTDLWRVELRLLTRFARWTTTLAETQDAYDSATKVLF